MERTRLTLHDELCKILESQNCYFSPPDKMIYPCIRYNRETPLMENADNIIYTEMQRWTVTIIDFDPDSKIPKRLTDHFEHYCRKDREYTTDGLYHFVYNLYY